MWSSGRDEDDAREVDPVEAGITGQEPVRGDRGMRADVEVGEWGRAPTAAPPIRDEALPREERGLVRQRVAPVQLGRQCVLEILPTRARDNVRVTVGANERYTPLVGRILIAAIFLLSGLGKLGNWGGRRA